MTVVVAAAALPATSAPDHDSGLPSVEAALEAPTTTTVALHAAPAPDHNSGLPSAEAASVGGAHHDDCCSACSLQAFVGT